MVKQNVDQVAEWVFKAEAGYAERPEEGGGAVNRGVTFTVFQAWRASKGQSNVTWADLKAMTKDEALQIYKAQFFSGVHFDELPSGLDYSVYDASVNGGVGGALTLLQEVLGLKPDGHFGIVTRWAANHRPLAAIIDAYNNARLAKYKTFPRWNKVANPKTGRTWGQVWTARIADTRKRSLQLAGGVQ